LASDAGDRWRELEDWAPPAQAGPLYYSVHWLLDRLASVWWPQPEDRDAITISQRRRRRLMAWANRADEAGELPLDLAYFMLAATIESYHDASFDAVLDAEYRPGQDAWALERGFDLNEDPLGWEELRDEPEWNDFEAEWERLRRRNWVATFSELADPHMARLAIEDLERFDRYREHGRLRLFGPLEQHGL
jgi:hypothetical protein